MSRHVDRGGDLVIGRVRDFVFGPGLGRDDLDEPVDGTNQTLWPAVSTFWSETFENSGLFISPRLAERIWIANRCIQLNAQQIASMPLRFGSTAPGGGFEPAWISNPDPNWYPNGISDAIFAIVRSLYGWGYAIVLVTDRYASGFPRSWTVLDPETVEFDFVNGRRAYKVNDRPLNRLDVIQIDRDPGSGLHGTSAIRAFATQAWSVVSSGELGRTVTTGGVPQAVIRSTRRKTKAQAEKIQAQWVAATSRRGGAPPVLDPELSFEPLSFSPRDLALLDLQEFNARALMSAYGVPPVLLNLALTGGLTYQNPAMLGEQWWRFELRPTSKRIADAFTAQALPAGNWVKLDASDTFAEIDAKSDDDDPQLSVVADVSPTRQNDAAVTQAALRSIGGTG
jgi:HK97 family phage portal protein